MMTVAARQYARFLLLRLDPVWRRLPAAEQLAHRHEFGNAVHGFRGRLLLRSFSLVGTRGDADLVLWQVADELDLFQAFQTAVFSTRLGGYLSIAYSYLGMTRRSLYQFPDDAGREPSIVVRPQDSRYLFLYPFVKTREWYSLPQDRRQHMMEEHIRVGRKYPAVRLNTLHSFGLDDQEFLLAFEADDPGEFMDLVMELRQTEASAYTLRDTPIFTGLQMSLWEALDALGGSTEGARVTGAPGSNGFTPVARLADLSEGGALRVYAGADAVALFKVGGCIYALSDRCTHGRASLSEGSVDRERGVLQCPWHGGQFDLKTGTPLALPARVPLKTYRVKVEGEHILVD